ncbi:MAG: hypothetical protein ACR2NR_20385 [Solirubrobacteraceae bacterium]
MAQTKRKRRTKHRGTAAGVVSSRGRTSRPASPEERKKQKREENRRIRLDKAPTWRSALNKALLAGGFMFVFLLVTSKFKIVPSVVFALFAMAIYVPAGYYLELFLYRRRMNGKEKSG